MFSTICVLLHYFGDAILNFKIKIVLVFISDQDLSFKTLEILIVIFGVFKPPQGVNYLPAKVTGKLIIGGT